MTAPSYGPAYTAFVQPSPTNTRKETAARKGARSAAQRTTRRVLVVCSLGFALAALSGPAIGQVGQSASGRGSATAPVLQPPESGRAVTPAPDQSAEVLQDALPRRESTAPVSGDPAPVPVPQVQESPHSAQVQRPAVPSPVKPLAAKETVPARLMYDPQAKSTDPRFSPDDEHFIFGQARQAGRLNSWGPQDPYCTGDSFGIVATAHGSFTRQNSDQKAFLYRYCDTGANSANEGLVITEHGKVIAHHVTRTNYSEMNALKDINRNGLSELLLGNGAGGGGTFDYEVSVFEYQGAQPRNLATIATVHDECGLHADTGSWVAAIYVSPGRTPAYFAQRLTGKCNAVFTHAGNRVAVDSAPSRDGFGARAVRPVAAIPDPHGVTGLFDTAASVFESELCRTYTCTEVKRSEGPHAGPEDRSTVERNDYLYTRYRVGQDMTLETRSAYGAGYGIPTAYLELNVPRRTSGARMTALTLAFLRSGIGKQATRNVTTAAIVHACTTKQTPLYASNGSGYGLLALCDQVSGNNRLRIFLGE